MYRNVLVPVDGSDAAFAALEVAVCLLDAKGTLTLLHVVPEGGLPEGLEAWADIEFAELPSQWRYNDAVGEAIVEAARSRASSCNHVERRVRRGDPARKVVEEAQELNADAIVIGTRGLSALKSLVVGSVAQKVLHNAKCPVVAVH